MPIGAPRSPGPIIARAVARGGRVRSRITDRACERMLQVSTRAVASMGARIDSRVPEATRAKAKPVRPEMRPAQARHRTIWRVSLTLRLGLRGSSGGRTAGRGTLSILCLI